MGLDHQRLHLDLDRNRCTPWHALVPQTRLLCALGFVFASALTPTGAWLTWGIYGLGLGVLILISQVTLGELVKRVVLEASFVGVVLLGTLFHSGETLLWQWGFLTITREGLIILGSVSLKALLSLVMLNILTLTTSVSDLLQGLTWLKTPPLLVAIMASMYRYLAVLITEFSTMRRAALSRNLMARPQGQRQIIGNMMGSLFIRSYERGDRVYQAMLARGYQGTLPTDKAFQMTHPDTIALSFLVALIILGQCAYFLN
jgi:cobalt/nickel transport system permease protein